MSRLTSEFSGPQQINTDSPAARSEPDLAVLIPTENVHRDQLIDCDLVDGCSTLRTGKPEECLFLFGRQLHDSDSTTTDFGSKMMEARHSNVSELSPQCQGRSRMSEERKVRGVAFWTTFVVLD